MQSARRPRRPATKLSFAPRRQQHVSDQPVVPPRSKGSVKGILQEVIRQCDQAITALEHQGESESESLNVADGRPREPRSVALHQRNAARGPLLNGFHGLKCRLERMKSSVQDAEYQDELRSLAKNGEAECNSLLKRMQPWWAIASAPLPE